MFESSPNAPPLQPRYSKQEAESLAECALEGRHLGPDVHRIDTGGHGREVFFRSKKLQSSPIEFAEPWNGDKKQNLESQSIQYLKHGASSFTGTISNIHQCPNLLSSCFGGHKLTGAIASLSRCTHLICVDISRNMFGGSIDALASCANLKRLKLQDNEFSGSASALASCTKLEHVEL